MVSLNIIILNYKNVPTTIKCLESVLASEFTDYAITIIDNGATKESIEQLEAYKTNNNLSKIVSIFPSYVNTGFGAGMNLGVTKAQETNPSKFVLLLNNDTILDKKCLTHLMEAIKIYGEQNVYIPVALLGNRKTIACAGMNDYIPTLTQLRLFGHTYHPQDKTITQVKYLSGACFLLTTDLFLQVKGINPEFFLYGEDVEFGISIQKQGGNIFCVNQANIVHEFSKSTGLLSPLKTYYITRNLLKLIDTISNNKFVDKTKLYIYITNKLMLGLVTLNFGVLSYIKDAFKDYKKGSFGPKKESL